MSNTTKRKHIARVIFELTSGIAGFCVIAFYSNVAVAVGVIVLIELNNYSRS